MRRKILALSIAVLLVFSLAGCAPKGYGLGFPIAKINPADAFDLVYFNVKDQFPEQNPKYDELGYDNSCMRFLYNNKTYYVLFESDNKRPVYKQISGEDVYLGDLISKIDKKARYHGMKICFLDEQYLYYQIDAEREVKYIFPTYGSTIYRKYEYYRFDLEIGKNEKISLESLFETLLKYQSEIIINPKYKVR